MIYIDLDEQALLKYAIEQGIINLDDVQKNMEEKEKQRLLEKHEYSIFQGSDGRWKTTVPDPTKKSGRKPLAKKNKEDLIEQILKYYREQEKEEDLKKHPEKTVDTLRKLYPLWIKSKELHTKATSYIKRINADWKKFYNENEIADKPLRELTQAYLDDWVHYMIKKHNMTKTTYYNMSIILRQCLDYACMGGINLLEANPFTNVRVNVKMFVKKQKPPRETQVFLNDEQRLISDVCARRLSVRPNCTTSLAVLLNFQLGLRIGELVALKWTDITKNFITIQRMEVEVSDTYDDGNGNMISTFKYVEVVDHVKSSAGYRDVYLNKEAKKVLRLIQTINMRNGYYDDNYIFISSHHKKRARARGFVTYLRRLCIEAGIINKSNHKIRKTFISSLFDKGINVDTIRRIAGHEDERTSFKNYCFDQSESQELYDKLEGAQNTNVVIKVSEAAL